MKESLDEQSRLALIKYRLDRAQVTISEANLLANEGYITQLLIACIMLASMLYWHYSYMQVFQHRHIREPR